MKKILTLLIIFSIIFLTAFVAKVNPQMHKTFQIERIIIKKGVN